MKLTVLHSNFEAGDLRAMIAERLARVVADLKSLLETASLPIS